MCRSLDVISTPNSKEYHGYLNIYRNANKCNSFFSSFSMHFNKDNSQFLLSSWLIPSASVHSTIFVQFKWILVCVCVCKLLSWNSVNHSSDEQFVYDSHRLIMHIENSSCNLPVWMSFVSIIMWGFNEFQWKLEYNGSFDEKDWFERLHL